MRNVTAKEFFIHAFGRDPNHPVERDYYAEWKERFASGHPESYMDTENLELYRKLQQKKLPYPKNWKGKGGISVRIVENKLERED